MSEIRVQIVDDHELFRRGLADILSEEPDIKVVAHAKDGAGAIKQALEIKPDVIFMDLNMPGQGGIETTAYLTQHMPAVKVLILTVSEEPQDLFHALRVGALGYVLKTASPAEIIDALRQVHQGWVVISPAMAPRFINDLSQPQPRPGAGASMAAGSVAAGTAPLPTEPQITSREEEILRLVAKGMSNADIAAQLVVSENTVKSHIKNILAKLHMKNRSEAAAYAARLGVLKTDGAGDAPPPQPKR